MTTLPTLAPVDSKETEVQCRQIMDQHGLQDWKFQWNRAVKKLGECEWQKKTISLARMQPDGDWKDTLLHEIAHALTPGAGHGPIWKMQCIRIGADPSPKVKALLNDNDYNWQQTCAFCGEEVSRSIGKRRTLYRLRTTCCGSFVLQERLVTPATTSAGCEPGNR